MSAPHDGEETDSVGPSGRQGETRYHLRNRDVGSLDAPSPSVTPRPTASSSQRGRPASEVGTPRRSTRRPAANAKTGQTAQKRERSREISTHAEGASSDGHRASVPETPPLTRVLRSSARKAASRTKDMSRTDVPDQTENVVTPPRSSRASRASTMRSSESSRAIQRHRTPAKSRLRKTGKKDKETNDHDDNTAQDAAVTQDLPEERKKSLRTRQTAMTSGLSSLGAIADEEEAEEHPAAETGGGKPARRAGSGRGRRTTTGFSNAALGSRQASERLFVDATEEPSLTVSRRAGLRGPVRPVSAAGKSSMSGLAERESRAKLVQAGTEAGSTAAPQSDAGDERDSTSSEAHSGPKSVSRVADPAPNRHDVHLWRKAELVDECRRRGLPTSGTKSDLLTRLSEHRELGPASPPERSQNLATEGDATAIPEQNMSRLLIQSGQLVNLPKAEADVSRSLDGVRLTRSSGVDAKDSTINRVQTRSLAAEHGIPSTVSAEVSQAVNNPPSRVAEHLEQQASARPSPAAHEDRCNDIPKHEGRQPQQPQLARTEYCPEVPEDGTRNTGELTRHGKMGRTSIAAERRTGVEVQPLLTTTQNATDVIRSSSAQVGTLETVGQRPEARLGRDGRELGEKQARQGESVLRDFVESGSKVPELDDGAHQLIDGEGVGDTECKSHEIAALGEAPDQAEEKTPNHHNHDDSTGPVTTEYLGLENDGDQGLHVEDTQNQVPKPTVRDEESPFHALSTLDVMRADRNIGRQEQLCEAEEVTEGLRLAAENEEGESPGQTDTDGRIVDKEEQGPVNGTRALVPGDAEFAAVQADEHIDSGMMASTVLDKDGTRERPSLASPQGLVSSKAAGGAKDFHSTRKDLATELDEGLLQKSGHVSDEFGSFTESPLPSPRPFRDLQDDRPTPGHPNDDLPDLDLSNSGLLVDEQEVHPSMDTGTEVPVKESEQAGVCQDVIALATPQTPAKESESEKTKMGDKTELAPFSESPLPEPSLEWIGEESAQHSIREVDGTVMNVAPEPTATNISNVDDAEPGPKMSVVRIRVSSDWDETVQREQTVRMDRSPPRASRQEYSEDLEGSAPLYEATTADEIQAVGPMYTSDGQPRTPDVTDVEYPDGVGSPAGPLRRPSGAISDSVGESGHSSGAEDSGSEDEVSNDDGEEDENDSDAHEPEVLSISSEESGENGGERHESDGPRGRNTDAKDNSPSVGMLAEPTAAALPSQEDVVDGITGEEKHVFEGVMQVTPDRDDAIEQERMQDQELTGIVGIQAEETGKATRHSMGEGHIGGVASPLLGSAERTLPSDRCRATHFPTSTGTDTVSKRDLPGGTSQAHRSHIEKNGMTKPLTQAGEATEVVGSTSRIHKRKREDGNMSQDRAGRGADDSDSGSTRGPVTDGQAKRRKIEPMLVPLTTMPTPDTTLKAFKPTMTVALPFLSGAGAVSRSLDFEGQKPDVASSILDRLSRIEEQQTRSNASVFGALEEGSHQANYGSGLRVASGNYFHAGAVGTGNGLTEFSGRRKLLSQPAARRRVVARVVQARKTWNSAQLAAQSLRRANAMAGRISAWKTHQSPFEDLGVTQNGGTGEAGSFHLRVEGKRRSPDKENEFERGML